MSSVPFNPQAVNPGFTLAAYPLFFGQNLKVEYAEKPGCGQYLAFAAAEGCYLLGITIGTIELVFWTAILLVYKAVHVFIPKHFETPTRIYNCLFGRAAAALVGVSMLFVSMSTFFATKEELLDKELSAIFTLNPPVEACKRFLDYQLFD